MSVSAMSFALLLTTAAATAVGAAALHAAHGLRKQVTALRSELAEVHGTGPKVSVPQARPTPAAEIREAVAEALAEERERELAEARAFWAAQESRDAADASPRLIGEAPVTLLGGLVAPGEELPFYVPRQSDFVGLEAMDFEAVEAFDDMADLPEVTEFAEDSPSWPRPAAATPRTRTSSRCRRRSSPTTSARSPGSKSCPGTAPSSPTSGPARSARSTCTSSPTAPRSA